MIVEWTKHRFSGGALALDVANTVVLRIDPARRFDRFENPGEIGRFAAAATLLRADELQGVKLALGKPAVVKPQVLRLRETTDALFRDAAEHRRLESGRLTALLDACTEALAGAGSFSLDGVAKAGVVRFEAAVAMSALGILHGKRLSRIRACANCGWLFLDRSRNASRIWCDMAVCGNRRKASRHYRRRREAEEIDDAVG